MILDQIPIMDDKKRMLLQRLLDVIYQWEEENDNAIVGANVYFGDDIGCADEDGNSCWIYDGEKFVNNEDETRQVRRLSSRRY